MTSAFRWVRRHIGVLCVIGAFVYCAIHAFDPPRLNWGDPESDYGVLSAGRNFQQYGFLKLHLTPYLIDPAVMTAGDRALVYTHYPQLPDLMNGIERTVFGFSRLAEFRLVSLCFAFGSLIFVYLLVSTYWSRGAAEATVALWSINPLWIQHADNLHHAPYAYFFGAASVYCLSRYLRAGEDARPRHLALAGVCLFFTFMASYDFWFFAPLLLAIVTYAEHRKVTMRGVRLLATLAVFAVAAIAFKWATNAWALGGIQGWLADLRYQITERSTNAAVKTSYASGIVPVALGRVEHYFSLPFLGVALFWALVPAWRGRRDLPGVAVPRANPIVVLAAALPFLCLFSELWVEQVYPTLLLISFYALASGVLISVLLSAQARAARLIGVVLLAGLLWNSLDEDVRFTKVFFDPRAIASLRTELDSVSAPGQRILVNHVFDGAYRYYFNHATVALIATPPSRMGAALDHYLDPSQSPAANANGAVFVQHKRVAGEMFDKSYYFIVARYRLWDLWADPDAYESVVDSLMMDRDAQLEAAVAARGRKISETPFYTVWRLAPTSSLPTAR